jgi:hypothetical protein
MHVARRVNPEACRSAPPLRWRVAVGPAEGPGERLVAGVTGLKRDAHHVVIGRDQPVRGALKQDPAAQRGGWLAGGGRNKAVEVISRQVSAGCQRSGRIVTVERVRQNVYKARERVCRCVHAPMVPPGSRRGLIVLAQICLPQYSVAPREAAWQRHGLGDRLGRLGRADPDQASRLSRREGPRNEG